MLIKQYLMALTLLGTILVTLNATAVESRLKSVITSTGDNFYEEKELAKEHLEILNITIGQHTLQDVQGILGLATSYRIDEEGRPILICYRSAEVGKNDAVLIFESGALGGWQMTTSFKLLDGKYKYKHNCRTTNNISRKISTESGIRLGISKDQLKKILGKPTKETRDTISYQYYIIKKMTEGEIEQLKSYRKNVRDYPYYEVVSAVEAHFKKTKMTSVEVSRVQGF